MGITKQQTVGIYYGAIIALGAIGVLVAVYEFSVSWKDAAKLGGSAASVMATLPLMLGFLMWIRSCCTNSLNESKTPNPKKDQRDSNNTKESSVFSPAEPTHNGLLTVTPSPTNSQYLGSTEGSNQGDTPEKPSTVSRILSFVNGGSTDNNITTSSTSTLSDTENSSNHQSAQRQG